MGYELRDHTADIAVAAWADSLTGVFEAAAEGFVAATCETAPAGTEDRAVFTVTAESREALLFDYLDELVYRRDVRAALPVANRVESIDSETDADSSETWVLTASASDAALAGVTAREIKAVTYSEMRLEQTADGWEAYVVFDV